MKVGTDLEAAETRHKAIHGGNGQGVSPDRRKKVIADALKEIKCLVPRRVVCTHAQARTARIPAAHLRPGLRAKRGGSGALGRGLES